MKVDCHAVAIRGTKLGGIGFPLATKTQTMVTTLFFDICVTGQGGRSLTQTLEFNLSDRSKILELDLVVGA